MRDSEGILADVRPVIKFGTEGWRGIIADDFTVANVRLVTRAIGQYLQKSDDPGQGVLIGYDTRAQSEVFANASAEILSSMGFPVTVCVKPSSTPACVCALNERKMQGAVIFSASHNPGAFHGIKFKPFYGGSALTRITDQIEKELDSVLDQQARFSQKPDAFSDWQSDDITEEYLSAIRRLIDLDAIRKANFKIVFDAMHGAGANYLQAFFPEIVAIRQERNPSFGGVNPEPIASNLDALFTAVRNENASVGIAVDGDADRVGISDENGEMLDSHRLYAILLKHLVERRNGKGGVVRTVSTTRMIDKLARAYNLPVSVTPIGFKYICEKMLEQDILIGGEESGGVGVPVHMKERDGIFAGLLLLEAMAMSGKTPSQLVRDLFAEVGEHHYSRIDLHYDRSEMPQIARLLKEVDQDRIGDTPVQHIERMDGTLFEFENGWLLLRASGTEPVVRVYSEASTSDQPAQWIEAGQTLIKQALSQANV